MVLGHFSTVGKFIGLILIIKVFLKLLLYLVENVEHSVKIFTLPFQHICKMFSNYTHNKDIARNVQYRLRYDFMNHKSKVLSLTCSILGKDKFLVR